MQQPADDLGEQVMEAHVQLRGYGLGIFAFVFRTLGLRVKENSEHRSIR